MKIVTDDKSLRIKSNNTSIAECDELKIWEKLEATLKENKNGVGLSAIQIGIPIRAALAKIGDKIHKLVNPKIIAKSDEMTKFDREGCLSIPNKYVNTLRHKTITVENEINGTVTYEGFESIVVQHEIDHMDGVLMTDRKMQPVKFEKKIGRNDKCPCGSGKKYKKCCGG